MTFRLLIADDHQATQAGLTKLVEVAGINVVGYAATGQQAIDQTQRYMPDVLISEVRFPDLHGIDAISVIRERMPSLPVMILSAYDNPTYAARLSLLGIGDYVLKRSSTERILDSLRRVFERKDPAPDSVLSRVRELMTRRRPEHIENFPLTQREFQVLRHVALGLSNREIGRSLKISIETVKEHVQNILRKVDASDRTQAAVWAVRRGLLDPPVDSHL